MAAFAPKPSNKLPAPIITRLTEKTMIIYPIIHTIQAINSPFLRPQLSPMCDIIIQPKREPTQLSDCKSEDIHYFEQAIITPQSNAIERGIGFYKCQYQKFQSSQLHTNFQQVQQSAISALVHVKSGTMQKKLSENKIIAAIIHLRAKARKIQY